MAEDSQVLPDIELPPTDGTFSFFLNYNGEPAFAVTIINEPGEVSPDTDLLKHVSARFKVSTMPINGGNGEDAEITLYMQGQDSDS